MYDVETASAELRAMFSEGVSAAMERGSSEFDRVLAESHGQLVLFGSGNLGRQALACLRRDGIAPLAFSDNNRQVWGTVVDGLPVLPPREAARRFGNDATFVVTIWNDRQRFAETADALTSLGCRRVIASPPLRWKYEDRIPLFPFFFLDLPFKLHEAQRLVLAGCRVWADDRSRREYVAQVRMRLFGDLRGLPVPEPDQYAPRDLFTPLSEDVFVDCGAFDGDTVQAFISAWRGHFKSIYALEPDPSSFRRLAAFVGELPARTAERIHVLQIGVGAESGLVSFKGDGTMGAAIADDGDVTIDCRTLDELFEHEAITYVKMDIEGQELAAIRGGMNLISRARPILATCVYHTQDHLWSIPLFLDEKLEAYRLFLRPHKPDGWDLITYAVPEERLPAGMPK